MKSMHGCKEQSNGSAVTGNYNKSMVGKNQGKVTAGVPPKPEKRGQ